MKQEIFICDNCGIEIKSKVPNIITYQFYSIAVKQTFRGEYCDKCCNYIYERVCRWIPDEM
jgi:hypothetical protein